jgi:hypothetical protein
MYWTDRIQDEASDWLLDEHNLSTEDIAKEAKEASDETYNQLMSWTADDWKRPMLLTNRFGNLSTQHWTAARKRFASFAESFGLVAESFTLSSDGRGRPKVGLLVRRPSEAVTIACEHDIEAVGHMAEYAGRDLVRLSGPAMRKALRTHAAAESFRTYNRE